VLSGASHFSEALAEVAIRRKGSGTKSRMQVELSQNLLLLIATVAPDRSRIRRDWLKGPPILFSRWWESLN
jgi:hypothetical protein